VIFDAFDVVVVSFPFTDRQSVKRRPALVLSDAQVFNSKIGQCILAMITSAKNSEWPNDIEISDLDSAGLSSESIVRLKLFTLDSQLIIRKAGSLSDADRQRVSRALAKVLPY